MTKLSTLIVVNPTSGNGRGKVAGEFLVQKLEKYPSGETKLVLTNQSKEATMLTSQAISDGASRIIAVGGDGTLHEVINGFFNKGSLINKDCLLGLINCGSGAGLAGTLNLPDSLDDQFSIAMGNKTKGIDLGLIQYNDEQGIADSRYFISECQTGIGGRVAMSVGPFLKRFGGRIGFGVSTFFHTVSIMARKVDVLVNEKMEYSGKLIGLVLGNGSECAGGMKITPGAELDDGKIDLLLIHNMNLLQRLLSLKKVYNGSHIHTLHFSYRQAEKIEIRTNTPWPVEADGEVIGFIGEYPLIIDVIPNAIEIMVP